MWCVAEFLFQGPKKPRLFPDDTNITATGETINDWFDFVNMKSFFYFEFVEMC